MSPHWIWTTSLLAACIEQRTAQLADLGDLGLAVHVRTGDEADAVDDARRPAYVTIYSGFDRAAFARTHDGACAVLGAVTATFNGAALEVYPGAHGDDDACNDPMFEGSVEVGLDEPMQLELVDESTSVRMTFAVEDISARIASLYSHPEWSFPVDDNVRLTWSHPEDAAGAFKVWFVQDGLEHLPSHHVYAENILTAADPAGVGFRVPDWFVGTGTIVVSVANASEPATATAETCIGAARCSAAVFRDYKHAVTLTPAR